MHRNILYLICIFFGFNAEIVAQQTPFFQWTLLPENQMDEIIGESSGETALNHATEMVGYQRNRPASEYGNATFREAAYVLQKLNEYGFRNANIERFEGRETWDGIRGELWEIAPGRKKLADYDDIALSLAQGSQNTNVEAELIWVEEGTETDFETVDVNGKIAVTSSMVGRVHNLAIQKGALGVISFGSSRELTTPTAIPASGIYGNNATFGFYLSPREGYKLRDRLINGEKIKVHAVVESQNLPYDLQVPTCVIPGYDKNAGELIISAHIFEGYTKQGGNDNISGSAVILEVARMIKQMVTDGRLPEPKRSIRFIWVPEYSGTIPWVNAHRDLMQKTLCNINLDMVGLHLKPNNSFFSLMRTTFGNPHYVNDVLENYFVYMGEVNREILANRGNQTIANQIIAPSGTDDAFYYQIEQHYGASDHEVFNHWSTHVPGVMLITWPDMFYHTSEDLPNKLDPTQLKRAAIIAAAGAYTIASADTEMAISIGEYIFSNASKRMGIELARATREIQMATSENFAALAKKVSGYLESTIINEIATVNSILELDPENIKLQNQIQKIQHSINGLFKANKALLDARINLQAELLGIKNSTIQTSALEKEAAEIIPKATANAQTGGFGIERSIHELPQEILTRFPYKNLASTTELCALINGKNSALDIKKMLDTQFKNESELQSIINYLELLKTKELIVF